jgi:hypothetical protein
LPRYFQQAMQDFLVPDVYAIEGAAGHDGLT